MIKFHKLLWLKSVLLGALIVGLVPLALASNHCSINAQYDSELLQASGGSGCIPNPKGDQVSLASVEACRSTDFPPTFFLRHLSKLLLKNLRNHHDLVEDDPIFMHSTVANILLPSFDQEKMAALTVMSHWRDASEQQKTGFIEQYRKKVVHDYGTSVLQFKDEDVCVPSQRYYNKKTDSYGHPYPRRLRVDSKVTSPNSQPIDVQYRVMQVSKPNGQGDEWKVYNFVVANLNMALNYRAQFKEELEKSKHGSVDGRVNFQQLIDKLKEKNDQQDRR